jgi:hypothetical protein
MGVIERGAGRANTGHAETPTRFVGLLGWDKNTRLD